MEISTKELRIRPGAILTRVLRGVTIVITYRGKKIARLVPMGAEEEIIDDGRDEIFGLWRNRDTGMSVEDEVRDLRRGRSF